MKRSALIVSTAIFLITHSTNLQVPLYGTYPELAGYGSGVSAVAFASYIAGLLPTLILLGGISDRIGRKKTMAWSLAGIVGIILPEQLRHNWSGAMLFIFVISGVLIQSLARKLPAKRSLKLGSILLIIGYLTFTCGAWLNVVALVIAGVAIAGTACYGFTYLGGLAQVVKIGGSQSARVTSGYFVCAYLGYGLPVVAIGFLAENLGTIATLFGFGAILTISNILLMNTYRFSP